MEHILLLRERYGSVYATELLDGRVVPWRPLTIGEFIEYDALFRQGSYPPAGIEDEIFNKCVLDEFIKKNKGSEHAGIVTLVVTGILLASGPQAEEELENILAMKRIEASGVLHQIVNFVTLAFPSYTPEDIYALDYQTLMARVALAESKLLQLGMIQEPLSFLSGAPGPQQRPQRPPVDDLLQRHYAQEGIQSPSPPMHQPPPPVPGEKTIISMSEMASGSALGENMEDKAMYEHQMVEEAKTYFSDYLQQIREGKQVRIKSPAERVQDRRAKMKETEKQAAERFKQAQAVKAQQDEKVRAHEEKVAEMLQRRAKKRRRR